MNEIKNKFNIDQHLFHEINQKVFAILGRGISFIRPVFLTTADLQKYMTNSKNYFYGNLYVNYQNEEGDFGALTSLVVKIDNDVVVRIEHSSEALARIVEFNPNSKLLFNKVYKTKSDSGDGFLLVSDILSVPVEVLTSINNNANDKVLKAIWDDGSGETTSYIDANASADIINVQGKVLKLSRADGAFASYTLTFYNSVLSVLGVVNVESNVGFSVPLYTAQIKVIQNDVTTDPLTLVQNNFFGSGNDMLLTDSHEIVTPVVHAASVSFTNIAGTMLKIERSDHSAGNIGLIFYSDVVGTVISSIPSYVLGTPFLVPNDCEKITLSLEF